MKQRLSEMTFDPELSPGARNAVRVCLRIGPSEKVTVITDQACQEIAGVSWPSWASVILW